MTAVLTAEQQVLADAIIDRARAVLEDHVIGRRPTRNERLLIRIDELYWNKRGSSPHENYRREREHAKLVKVALAKGLIAP